MVNCIVIDDDQDIVDVFSDLLDVHNVDVLATDNSGKNSLKLYEQFKPDLVFTDLQMPGYDGIYVVESIRDVFPNAKIVVVTGAINTGFANLLRALHVPIILKPFNGEKILKVISDSMSNEIITDTPFEIQYQFKNDVNVYSCNVTYQQYRNFKKLPVISEIVVVAIQKTLESYSDEMQNALDLAEHDDHSQILKLSEIVPDE